MPVPVRIINLLDTKESVEDPSSFGWSNGLKRNKSSVSLELTFRMGTCRLFPETVHPPSPLANTINVLYCCKLDLDRRLLERSPVEIHCTCVLNQKKHAFTVDMVCSQARLFFCYKKCHFYQCTHQRIIWMYPF